jgi:DNA-binding transcriptional MerR regulator
MEYTITELARISGVSTRTLRHYDAIGLLQPSRVSGAGYRFYGTDEADTLQQILFYRELGVSLEQIGAWLRASDFDRVRAMEGHLASLRERRDAMDRLIENAERTLRTMKGEDTMRDEEKFAGYKQALVEENEAKYGAEVREKYGLYGPFSFMVETDGSASFSEDFVKPLDIPAVINDYRLGNASHGYEPEKGPQPVFYGRGPAFRENVTVPTGRVIDIAPTLARILGQEMPQADGRALTELLTQTNAYNTGK